MTRVAILYWYDIEHMKLDGGGRRALAWRDALRNLGADAEVVAIHPGPLPSSRPGPRTRVKRILAPMPFARSIEVPEVEAVIATVPGTFPSLARTKGPSPKVVFDWMDLWSINSRTMGSASLLSRPGGLVQSYLWRRRESWLPQYPAVNTFAGYGDLTLIGRSNDVWLPTPVPTPSRLSVPGKRLVQTVGFLGNLDYEPNEFSLRKFLRTHSSSLRERNIELVVAGFGSERVREWGYEVTVLGTVKNITEFYLSIDAAVVPIDHGGGIKVKAIEALAHGVPVIGTEHVRSGLPPSLAASYVIDLNEFLSQSLPTVEPPSHPEIAGVFSPEAFEGKVQTVMERVLAPR